MDLALLATIRGDAAGAALFSRALSFVNAAHIHSDANLGPLLESPPADADAGVLKQLRYMFEAGGWVLRESAIADLPGDLRWLYESGAVTIEQLASLFSSLGTTSTADLLAELRRHSIRSVPGFTQATEDAIAAALPTLRKATPRISLGRAMTIADDVVNRLRQVPGVDTPTFVGSIRRGHDMVGDVEIVAAAADATPALDALLTLPDIARVLHRSERRLYLLTDRVQIGIRCVPPDSLGAALLHLTGSHAHIDALRRLACDRGSTLDPEGLTTADGRRIADSEAAIYEGLGLPWIPPEIRDGSAEMAAAAQGSLSALVSRSDIRGDLHMHSDWSDGRDPIERMVRGCIALGYQYMAITDHSQRCNSSRKLSADDVKRQAEEIAGLRQQFPQITILHGCEVEILSNGRLDFSDRILNQFDLVLASLHDGAGHSGDQLLQRYLAAMRHPAVNVITHPTNRQLPHRPGYNLDYERLFEAAVETRTAVEIDGAPGHLDMNGSLTRQAIAAGATVSIDSDCHRADLLGRQMELGLLLARNGWVEPRHVLNARPLEDVREWIAAKRQR